MQVYHRRQGTVSVDAYGCRWHRDRGADVCAVGLRRPKADVEAVVVAALREAALQRLGDVVARVRELLRATTGADDRSPLRAELAKVRREGERLTAALASSEEQPAVLVREIDARARRARELEAALAAPSVTSIDVARVEQLVLAEVDALGEACARCPAEGRAAVERLVDGPLVAGVVQTAEGPRFEIRGALRACTTVGVPSGIRTVVHFVCAA